MMQNRRQYHCLVERWLPLSNRKSSFVRLFILSAEVLPLYSFFQAFEPLDGMLMRRRLSFIARCTVLPRVASEHGFSHMHLPWDIIGHWNLMRFFDGSDPSCFIFSPALHIGIPSLPSSKSSLYFGFLPRLLFRSINGVMPCSLKYL